MFLATESETSSLLKLNSSLQNDIKAMTHAKKHMHYTAPKIENLISKSTCTEYIFYTILHTSLIINFIYCKKKTDYFPLLFCGLLVAKLITLHTKLHSTVYYVASSSVNLLDIEECFR
jgi:hypothetical protein